MFGRRIERLERTTSVEKKQVTHQMILDYAESLKKFHLLWEDVDTEDELDKLVKQEVFDRFGVTL